MPDELEFQKLKKEYPEFFKNLPPKLLEMILGKELSSKISDMCLKNGIENNEKIEEASYHIASVLLGQLPPEILPKALATNLKIDAMAARKISEEVNRLIFSQVKDDLSRIYQKGIPLEKPKEEFKEEPKRPPKKDTYHEPIE